MLAYFSTKSAALNFGETNLAPILEPVAACWSAVAFAISASWKVALKPILSPSFTAPKSSNSRPLISASPPFATKPAESDLRVACR